MEKANWIKLLQFIAMGVIQYSSTISIKYFAHFLYLYSHCFVRVAVDVAQVFWQKNVVPAFLQTTLRNIQEPQFIGYSQFPIPLSYISGYGNRCPLKLRAKSEPFMGREMAAQLIDGKYKRMCLLPSNKILEAFRLHTT